MFFQFFNVAIINVHAGTSHHGVTGPDALTVG
jgi:hypothetical protein